MSLFLAEPFASILSAHGMPQQQLTYTSRLGIHRSFASPEEVGAYEWGYTRWPRMPDCEDDGGPEWQGWNDCAALDGMAQIRELDAAWAARKQA